MRLSAHTDNTLRPLNRVLYVALLVIVTASIAEADESLAIATAKNDTVSWLAQTDTGEYESTWESAAALFQAAISKQDWSSALSAARSPMGALLSREVASANYSTTLPGAPDGEYVVFQFNTSFENKASAVETVTAMKDLDGEWRVAGYFIK